MDLERIGENARRRREARKGNWIGITFCHQGGVGYPPSIFKSRKGWRAISDSQIQKPPVSIESLLRADRFHSKGWALRKFNNAPQMTWAEVERELLH